MLLLSEMLTNVLVHTDARRAARGRGQRGRAAGGRRLRVEVSDTSDDLPHKRRPGELASSGRGLVLMELLADTWGVDPRGEGKTIWFELREREAAEVTGPCVTRPCVTGPCLTGPCVTGPAHLALHGRACVSGRA